MKKIIFILFLLLLPISAKASYGIENYKMDITILETGDIQVLEAFEMNGVYNGMNRNISYKGNYENYYGTTISSLGDSSIYDGNGIVLNEIRGINFDQNESFNSFITNGDLFNKVESASKGDYGYYVVKQNENGEEYIIYNHSKMNKDFYLSYILKNMAIVHSDVAELGLNVFTEMNESINNLEIIVHIPNNKNLLYVWTHGISKGNSTIIDSETVKINISNLDNNPLDFRLTFDKDVINESTKITNMEALDNILEIEMRLDLEANEIKDEEYNNLKNQAYEEVNNALKSKKRNDYDKALLLVEQLREEDIKYELQDKLDNLLIKIQKIETANKIINTTVILGFIIGIVILFVIIYLKYDKEYKTRFNKKYYYNFPNSYDPAIVGYLIRKKVNNNDLSASILNLINNKIISYKIIDNRNYKLIKLKYKKSLNDSEEKLIKFLFDNQNEISSTELKKRAKNDYEGFITNYSNWLNRVTIDAENEYFYEDTLTIKLIGVIYSIIGIVTGVLLIDKASFVNPFIMITIVILFLIYCLIFTKRSKKGNEDRSKWLALKHFMKDFSSFEDNNLPEVKLWKKYLTYAITLGCFNRLSKEMKSKLIYKNDKNVDEFNQTLMISKLINHSIKDIVKIAYNTKSSVDFGKEK